MHIRKGYVVSLYSLHTVISVTEWLRHQKLHKHMLC